MPSLKYVFALFVIVLAVLWAGALIVVPQFFAGMSSTQRYTLAVIMFIYASYRGFRVYKDYQYSKIEEDENN